MNQIIGLAMVVFAVLVLVAMLIVTKRRDQAAEAARAMAELEARQRREEIEAETMRRRLESAGTASVTMR